MLEKRVSWPHNAPRCTFPRPGRRGWETGQVTMAPSTGPCCSDLCARAPLKETQVSASLKWAQYCRDDSIALRQRLSRSPAENNSARPGVEVTSRGRTVPSLSWPKSSSWGPSSEKQSGRLASLMWRNSQFGALKIMSYFLASRPLGCNPVQEHTPAESAAESSRVA